MINRCMVHDVTISGRSFSNGVCVSLLCNWPYYSYIRTCSTTICILGLGPLTEGDHSSGLYDLCVKCCTLI